MIGIGLVEGLLIVLIVGGIASALVAIARRGRREAVRAAVARAVARLGLPADVIDHAADGAHRVVLPPITGSGAPADAPRPVLFVGRGSSPAVSLWCPVGGAPVEVTVRPELLGESMDKAFGFTIDQPVGDAAFDRAFVVESAPPEAAKRVLVREVRKLMLGVPRDAESPRLRVRPGHLEVAWEGAVTDDVLVEAVYALQATAAACAELREGVDVAAATPFRAGVAGSVDPADRDRARRALARARWRFAALVAVVASGGVAAVVAVLLQARGG